MAAPDQNKEVILEALFEHVRGAARRAREALAGPLEPRNLEAFLTDSRCLRYRTEICYIRTGLEPHQLAQPFMVAPGSGVQCRLHVDPSLQNRPDPLCLVVAYTAAAVNYGDAATPALAETYGSLLTGIQRAEFYNQLCVIAEDLALLSWREP